MNNPSFDRRRFLAGSGIAAGALASAPGIQLHAKEAHPDLPHNIIHLVSDGMSMGTLTCADYLSQIMRKRGLVWVDLLDRQEASTCFVNMRSLDSYVTDSSAASSSWGGGKRINNGAVNMLPGMKPVTPIYEILKGEGWQRGLVTTTEITHATPAGFGSSVPKRSMGEDIAEQYLQRNIDVLLGGGSKHFDKSKRKDGKDLAGEYKAKGYKLMSRAADLEKAPSRQRWLGLFASGHLPYTVDHMNDPELKKAVPTLATMTKAALKRLTGKKRFMLQVEGGRVDHGCHSCDAIGAFRDQIAFDEALEACLEHQQSHPETLLVITTDHGNGNPGLNGTGANYVGSNALLANLSDATASLGVMLSRMGKTPTILQIRKVIEEATGYKVPGAKAEIFQRFLNKKGGALYEMMNKPSNQLGQLLANHWAIGWAGSAHTADYVPLTAVGPGAENFSGFIQNTDVFDHYMKFAGVK
ncbi:alkaline phosphatase [Verrucomicrobia bacterium]|nr:alkaline phosphatase [Verrucomicrobiota bacterium]